MHMPVSWFGVGFLLLTTRDAWRGPMRFLASGLIAGPGRQSPSQDQKLLRTHWCFVACPGSCLEGSKGCLHSLTSGCIPGDFLGSLGEL